MTNREVAITACIRSTAPPEWFGSHVKESASKYEVEKTCLVLYRWIGNLYRQAKEI
jgi:hypothetical protein